MSRDLSLAAWQVRYEQRAFWRNPRAAFFSFAFPLLLLVFITAVGGDAEQAVPGLLAYGVAMSTYTNLAISFAVLRDNGVIRRVQGTPLPWWAYLAGRIGSTTINAALMSTFALVLGVVAYGLDLPLAAIPGLVLTLVLAVMAFTGLGIGVTRFIANADSAPAIASFSVLPLAFISGVFAPTAGEPDWLLEIARVFPLQPLADGLRSALGAASVADGVVARDLFVLLAWSAIGAWLSVRFLRSLTADA